MLFRYRAAKVIDRVRLPSAVLSLRGATGLSPFVTVLSYHRVNSASAGDDFYEGTVDVTPESFDLQVAFAMRWFDVIGMDDLLAFARGGKLPKNPLLITFDDGYLDNRQTALPILVKHKAPATFFISTTYVGDRRIFWWDRISYMVKRSSRERIDLTYPNTVSLPLSGPGEKDRAAKALRRVITEHFGIDLWRFLDHVAEATGVNLSRDEERRIAADMIMTWDDVHALRAAGMSIQSHTCDHYVITTLGGERLRTELQRSREILEGELREEVRAISYPVGRGSDGRPELREEVKRAGYELGFSNASGINLRWGLDPLNIRRLSADLEAPDEYFKTVLAVPHFAY